MNKKILINGSKYDFRFAKRLPRMVYDNESGKYVLKDSHTDISLDKPKISIDGYCEHSKHPKIRIRQGLHPKYELEVILHELLHAGSYGMSEERVTDISTEMANLVWDLGWRKLC